MVYIMSHLPAPVREVRETSCYLPPVLQHGDPFPVLVWTVAGHFLFKSSGNLPVECHYLVFVCGLNYCRHLVSDSTLHTTEECSWVSVMAEDWDSARISFTAGAVSSFSETLMCPSVTTVVRIPIEC